MFADALIDRAKSRVFTRRRAGLALVVMLSAAMLVAGAGGADGSPAPAPIQPGAAIGSGFGCTLNFVFRDDAERLYIGTAGHCTAEVGQEVSLYEDGSIVGEVVFRHIDYRDPFEDPMHNGPAWIHYVAEDPDFALIAVDRERYDDVSPAVRGWGGPTGVADPSETAVGDLVYVYGQGAGMRQRGQQARAGSLLGHDEHMFEFAMPISGGDSGSPVIHAATGMALGHVHGFHNGPPLTRALEALAAAGFDVELVTGPPVVEVHPTVSRVLSLFG